MFPTVRSLGKLSALLILFFPLSDLSAQELGGGGSLATKENLDLPFDAVGEDEEEEDVPEIVMIYDQALEGDGIFYVIDKSGTMRDQGELDYAKREVIRNISEFSSRVTFGIVFFDSTIQRFPPSGMPAEANAGMKTAAQSFVQSVQGTKGSCCQQGLMAALQMANLAPSKRKVLVYVGDGGGTCNNADEALYLKQTLGAVTAQNYQRITINTIGVLSPSPLGVDFMKRLASSNGGTYTRITRG